jgi:hypothetical protein
MDMKKGLCLWCKFKGGGGATPKPKTLKQE